MPYPYGMQNSPVVGNGLGGLPRRAGAAAGAAAGAWRAVGAPVTVAESNYKGYFRDNIAVDRSTSRVMLMENNAAGSSLSATIYGVSGNGIATIASGSTNNGNWVNTCAASASYQRRVVGAQGTFWLTQGSAAYTATVSGGVITFGTTNLSIPSTTPVAGGGTVGSVINLSPGTLAASDDGRLFGYGSGRVIEINPTAQAPILASASFAGNIPTNYVAGGCAAFNRYFFISDASTTDMTYYSASFDLLNTGSSNVTKSPTQTTPSGSNGRAIIVDPIDETTFSINSCYGYGNQTSTPYVDGNLPDHCNAIRFSSATSQTLIGGINAGSKLNRLSCGGEMLLDVSPSSLGWGLQESRFLVGSLPSQRNPSGSTVNTIAFSVSQNLAVVIIGSSMQAYAR
jgi:hypothetical protein